VRQAGHLQRSFRDAQSTEHKISEKMPAIQFIVATTGKYISLHARHVLICGEISLKKPTEHVAPASFNKLPAIKYKLFVRTSIYRQVTTGSMARSKQIKQLTRQNDAGSIAPM